MRKIKKKAAIELSMTTIVVVVLSLVLLIMGFVLVRTIMCGAIDLTKKIGQMSKDQVDDLLGSTGGEIQCLGELTEVAVSADDSHPVSCRVDADQETTYLFKTEIDVPGSSILDKGITETELKRWLRVDELTETIGSSDKAMKPVARLDIPDNAPEGTIILKIEIWKKAGRTAPREGTDPIYRTKRVEYKTDQVGAIKGFLC